MERKILEARLFLNTWSPWSSLWGVSCWLTTAQIITKIKQNLTSDDWTPPTAPTTDIHSFLLNMKSAEIQGTLRELVTFRSIYIFLTVTKHSSPCSIDEDIEVKEYAGPSLNFSCKQIAEDIRYYKIQSWSGTNSGVQKTHSSSCSPTGGCCRRATLVYQFQGVKSITNNFYILKNHS